MRHSTGGLSVVCVFMLCLGLPTSLVHGEVLDITGSSSATVIQFSGVIPIQSDIAQNFVPLTIPEPPAVSTALLENQDIDGFPISAGQCLAVLDKPDFSGLGNPNDVGLDLGAFSDDGFSSWFVEGIVNETRSLVFGAFETDSTAIGPDNRATAESRIALSGVLVLTGTELTTDMSGTASSISILLVKRQTGELPVTLMEGELIFAGGPNGDVFIASATGVFANVLFSIEDFNAAIPTVPLAVIVPFRGLALPYQYDYIVDVPFELDLTVVSQVRATPAGTGAAAVFGVLPTGLPSVFDRVKQDDRGQRLADIINGAVDTTGSAYGAGASAPSLFPFCGVMGVEAIGTMTACCLLVSGRQLRRRTSSRGRG